MIAPSGETFNYLTYRGNIFENILPLRNYGMAFRFSGNNSKHDGNIHLR